MRRVTAVCRSWRTCRGVSPVSLSTPEPVARGRILSMRTAVSLALALSFAVACAPKRAPASIASTPRFPDFVAPVVPVSFVGTPAAASQARGWALLEAGDLDQAEKEFVVALKGRPAFYPAEISIGYLELARR